MTKQVPNMTSGVVVTKSAPVVVRPSELELATLPPAGDTTVALSSFDRRVPPFSVTSLLVFDRAIDKPVETIKAALSRALAHYLPIAGRLDSGAGIITCTDEGVTFAEASASCDLEDAMAAAPHQTEDLALYYPGLLCRDADPLLLVQVTEFACGGFTVGVTSNHIVADGMGTAQFLHAVAEVTHGVSPPSIVPVRHWDDGADYSSLTASPAISTPRSTIELEARQRLARVDVVIPSRLIGRVKAAEHCTVLEAVMAVLWRCRTRAATSHAADDADRPALLNFACDMRALAGAPAGYYGNCLRLQVVPATAGAVAGSSIGQLVRLIRRAKEKVPELLLPGKPGGGGGGEVPPEQVSRWYEMFNVTDWRNLGLHAVDFGSGVPARVLWHNERTAVPFCVVCPARRKGTGTGTGTGDDNGVDVSSRFLKPEHADAFLAELSALAAASSPSAE